MPALTTGGRRPDRKGAAPRKRPPGPVDLARRHQRRFASTESSRRSARAVFGLGRSQDGRLDAAWRRRDRIGAGRAQASDPTGLTGSDQSRFASEGSDRRAAGAAFGSGRTPGHDRRGFASMESDRRRAQAALRLRVSRASINTCRPKRDRIGSRRERPSVSEDLKGFDGRPLRPKRGRRVGLRGLGQRAEGQARLLRPRGAGLRSPRPVAPAALPPGSSRGTGAGARLRGRRSGQPQESSAGRRTIASRGRPCLGPVSQAPVSRARVSGPRVSGPSRAPIPGARDGSQCRASMSGT